MQMYYNSEHFAVVVFEVPTADAGPAGHSALSRGGYEIVDKFARKEIFIEGALAERFEQGVQALAAHGPNEEALDEFIGGFTTLAQQPVLMH